MEHKDNKDVKKDEMSVDSFSLYESTDEDPKIVDGEKVINSFDIYPEENSDTDHNND